MGNRLSKITTRTGDDGTTGLGDNSRLSKAAPRIQAIGDVDELNSHIGLLLCEELPADVSELLNEVQHQLFNVGGELSMPGYQLLKDDALLRLEAAVETLNAPLPRLKEFILPAGSRAASQAHVCRAVARRAERSVIAIEATQEGRQTMHPGPRQYLNRLSDWLFVLARHLNLNHGGGEVYWKSDRLARQQDGAD